MNVLTELSTVIVAWQPAKKNLVKKFYPTAAHFPDCISDVLYESGKVFAKSKAKSGLSGYLYFKATFSSPEPVVSWSRDLEFSLATQ